MQRFWDVILYTILAAMVVLVVMNAKSVSGLLATGGNVWITQIGQLTGSSYGQPVQPVKSS